MICRQITRSSGKCEDRHVWIDGGRRHALIDCATEQLDFEERVGMFELEKIVSKINVEIEVHLDDGSQFLGMVSVRHDQRVSETIFSDSNNPASEVTLEPWNSSFKRRSKSSLRTPSFDSPIG